MFFATINWHKLTQHPTPHLLYILFYSSSQLSIKPCLYLLILVDAIENEMIYFTRRHLLTCVFISARFAGIGGPHVNININDRTLFLLSANLLSPENTMDSRNVPSQDYF